MKAFPIPVVALGPGTQTEDENLDYLPMPKDMDTSAFEITQPLSKRDKVRAEALAASREAAAGGARAHEEAWGEREARVRGGGPKARFQAKARMRCETVYSLDSRDIFTHAL